MVHLYLFIYLTGTNHTGTNHQPFPQAYGHTLLAFFKAFPELASNSFYLAGESYFGQYGPNIAYTILSNREAYGSINLKGMLVGNGCWGGNETHVECNGPNTEKNDIATYFGKNLISSKLNKAIAATCAWGSDRNRDGRGGDSPECSQLLDQASHQVGPHNVYDIYDNCPRTSEYLKEQGNKTMRWLLNKVRALCNRRGQHMPWLQSILKLVPWLQLNLKLMHWLQSILQLRVVPWLQSIFKASERP